MGPYYHEMDATVEEATQHFGRLLRQVESGETVVIRRGRVRVALLTPVPTGERRIWGDVSGSVTTIFDEPLEEFSSDRG